MLILSRKIGEQIVVGRGENAIIITLVEVRDLHKVRIGIDAPQTVTVHRKEIYDKIIEEETQRDMQKGLPPRIEGDLPSSPNFEPLRKSTASKRDGLSVLPSAPKLTQGLKTYLETKAKKGANEGQDGPIRETGLRTSEQPRQVVSRTPPVPHSNKITTNKPTSDVIVRAPLPSEESNGRRVKEKEGRF